MPLASQRRVNKVSNVSPTSPRFQKKKVSIPNDNVEETSQTYRYQITNTNITEIKVVTFRGDEKDQNKKIAGSSNRKVNPMRNNQKPYSKSDPVANSSSSIPNGPRRYSYNQAALANNPNIASDLEDVFQHLAQGLYKDNSNHVEHSNITSDSPSAAAFGPNSSINGGGGSDLGVRSRATALDVWGQRHKVPAYFVSNFDKARFRLKTDALNMASMQLKMPKKDIWKCLIAELLGTCLLIIIGCGSGLSLVEPKALSLTGVGLCWGLTVATLAQVCVI